MRGVGVTAQLYAGCLQGRVMATSVETGILYCDDNLTQLASLPDESIDLIYLDPPFFSNRTYEVIWGDEAEVRSFEDRWAGGMQVYIEWMRARVSELHRVLHKSGSLYLHCDPHASHYIKVMLDSIFGIANFRNEIVWRRTGAHGKTRRFGPIHDVIFFYTKSDNYVWNNPRRPYMRGHVEQHFVRDEAGWRTNYYGNVLTGSGRRGGLSGQPWRGLDPSAKGRHWAIPSALLEDIDEDMSHLNQHQKLDRLYELGRIKIDRNRYWPIYQHYISASDGTPAPDIWAYQPYTEGTVFGTEDGIDADVRWLPPRDKERLGYPTQKPEALLRRIIQASSNSGALILDPFCGCGTTVAVAEQVGRDWIGIDISPTAVNIMNNRILKATHHQRKPRVIGLPQTEDDLRRLKRFEFINWVLQRSYAKPSTRKAGASGIDGYSFMLNDPIQVRQQDRVGREVVEEFEALLEKRGYDKGFIVAFSFSGGAAESVASAHWLKNLKIELVTVKDLLHPEPERKIPMLPGDATVTELPLPPTRSADARPSAEELIESDSAVG
jgi:DNA modification methylase